MKKNLILILSVISLIFVLSCSQEGDKGPTGPSGEDVAILQFQQDQYPSNAYTGVTDAYLEGGNYAATNYGNNGYLYVGRFFLTLGSHNGAERFVLKFDLNELQNQYIKVKKAQIILYCNSEYPSPTTMTVTPYEITTPWKENEVTWNNRQTGTTWNTAGGDYNTIKAGNSVYINKSLEYKIFDINASVVQKWIDNPNNNYGLIFISDTENLSGSRYFGFYSSNNSTVKYRPKLVIYYTLN